jgi:hypothetical protein
MAPTQLRSCGAETGKPILAIFLLNGLITNHSKITINIQYFQLQDQSKFDLQRDLVLKDAVSKYEDNPFINNKFMASYSKTISKIQQFDLKGQSFPTQGQIGQT